jgi:hypothetical protein
LEAVAEAHTLFHLTVFRAARVVEVVTMPSVAPGVPAQAAKDMLAALAILPTMLLVAVVALLLSVLITGLMSAA